MAIDLNIDATITAIGGLVLAAATAFTAIKTAGKQETKDSDSKAVAVSDIDNTTKQVGMLWDRVYELTEEISELRKERENLQQQIDKLNQELATEKDAHAETRKKLDDALAALAAKDAKIKELEEKLNGYNTVK